RIARQDRAIIDCAARAASSVGEDIFICNAFLVRLDSAALIGEAKCAARRGAPEQTVEDIEGRVGAARMRTVPDGFAHAAHTATTPSCLRGYRLMQRVSWREPRDSAEQPIGWTTAG